MKGDELSPKILAAGAASGCYIDGHVQEGKSGRLGRDAETFLRLPRRTTSHGQTNPILLSMGRPVSSTSKINTYSYSCKVNLTIQLYFGM